MISATDLITLLDETGAAATGMLGAIDTANAAFAAMKTDVGTIFSGDEDEKSEWLKGVNSIYKAASARPFGASGGLVSLTFGGAGMGGSVPGSGLVNRQAILYGALFNFLDVTVRGGLTREARADGIASDVVNDIISYAAYRNRLTQTISILGGPTSGTFTLTYKGATTGAIARNPSASDIQTALRALSTVNGPYMTVAGSGTVFTVTISGPVALAGPAMITATASFGGGTSPSVQITPAFDFLVSPDFATAYWYVYNQGKQIAPSTGESWPAVFAPADIVLCHFAITGTGAGTVSNNAATNWPTANGYTAPLPTTDGFGNQVYIGGLPMAQAFAPIKTAKLHITQNINGTCAVTVTSKNQAGISHTWTVAADNATAGQDLDLTPAFAIDRMNLVPTAIGIAGTATAGAFDVATVAER